MRREDARLIPLAALGLTKGVYEVFVVPFAQRQVSRLIEKVLGPRPDLEQAELDSYIGAIAAQGDYREA